MDPNKDYFVNHDGKTSGPLGLEEIREKLQSGQFKADDLVVAKGGSEWLQLSEVVQSEELPGIPSGDEQEIAEEPSNYLKISKGLGVASVVFILLSLLLWTFFAGVNVWVELELRKGFGNFEEIFEARRMWNMVIVPFGTLSGVSAFICLICADRSYTGNGLLGLLMGFQVFSLLFTIIRYLSLPFEEWFKLTFTDNIGLVFWLFFLIHAFLGWAWVGLMMIRRKNGYRIVLFLSLLISFLWNVTYLLAWGSEIFPDLLEFTKPVFFWLRSHGLFTALMFWVCGTVIPMIGWLILAIPLVFGKSTRPEPEIEASQA